MPTYMYVFYFHCNAAINICAHALVVADHCAAIAAVVVDKMQSSVGEAKAVWNRHETSAALSVPFYLCHCAAILLLVVVVIFGLAF